MFLRQPRSASPAEVVPLSRHHLLALLGVLAVFAGLLLFGLG